jgi:RND family efflux transporter MFP subunit
MMASLRLARLVAGLIAFSSAWLTSAVAGPGHDHDHGHEPAGASAPASPRVTATSEHYQFVGIVEGEVLVIYLDRNTDNAPVTGAKLEVTIGDKALTAELQPTGTYEVASALLKSPGVHEVLVNVTEGSLTDLLVGSIKIASREQPSAGFDHSMWEHVKAAAKLPSKMQGTLGAAFALVIGFGLLALRRNRSAALGLIVIGLLVFASTAALAGPGHDHGPEPGGATNGNAPQRRPDGNVFLPKPSQRLLEVRTRSVAPETTSKAVRFVGRIIANPNRSGVVQSTIQGRFIPAPDGVATIGTWVKVGDLLGSVAPSFVSKESSDMAQTLGELDQQISLARAKLARQETLLRTNVVSRAAVDETRLSLDGYVKRRQELLASRIAPEELRAPVDGVITATRVTAGQVVSQTDQLFTIVDTSSLLVEALVFDQSIGDQFESVVATVNEQVAFSLKFLGRSRALQQQYSVLKFAVVEPTPALNVGTPVMITGRAGAQVTGIILPRAAVAQAPNGQMVVFNQKEPEIFEPKAIRFEPFDAQSVLVQAGLEKGDKIVVQGAPLINQVR